MIYGWVGAAFAAAGLWFTVGGAVLSSRLSPSPEAQDSRRPAASRSARRLGFGEVAPRRSETEDGRKVRPAPYGFLAPALRRRPAEDPDAPARHALPEPLDGKARLAAAEGVSANARSSLVFGLFCLAASAFWWGFRLLDPAANAERASR
jgi:hypothetical protein